MSYSNLVLQNAPAASQLELSLKSMGYIVSGRSRDSELMGESVVGLVKMLQLYHDTILSKEARRQQPKAKAPLNRFLESLLRRSRSFKRLAHCLSFLQAFEIALEMLAFKRFGKEIQEKLCIFIEALKLAIFHITGHRMLQKNAMPIRDYDPGKIEANSSPSKEESKTDDADKANNTGFWKGPRTGIEYFSVESLAKGEKTGYDKATQYMLSRALSEAVANPLDLSAPLTGIRLVGEYAYLVRPLIYVIAIQKFGSSSFKPWTLSLLIELFALSSHVDFSTKTLSREMPNMDKETFSSRVSLLSYYLLRNPVFSTVTKPRIDAIVNWTSTKPIINIAGSIISGYTELIQQYHFYTNSF